MMCAFWGNEEFQNLRQDERGNRGYDHGSDFKEVNWRRQSIFGLSSISKIPSIEAAGRTCLKFESGRMYTFWKSGSSGGWGWGLKWINCRLASSEKASWWLQKRERSVIGRRFKLWECRSNWYKSSTNIPFRCHCLLPGIGRTKTTQTWWDGNFSTIGTVKLDDTKS